MANDYLLQEDGVSKIILEDGTGDLILESSTAAADDIGAQAQRVALGGRVLYGLGPVRSA